ncbi:hypothetical protein [Isoptericola croceus]|uniref:hypothetical protein n=1 Tax=Isoptericola croceus TaxID=3031406 RepID=UPI0023F87FE3|nr:hypothetical protein [Isoptericola croceus]
MTDEQLVERMRSLAEAAPAISVDREKVLAAGRRRRTLRAAGVTGGVGVLCTGLVVGALAWAGPLLEGPVEPLPASSGEPTADPSEADDPLPDDASGPQSWDVHPPSPDDGEHAVVDYEAGTIWLPMDDWAADPEQQAVIDTAERYLHIECLTEAGYGDEVEFVGMEEPLGFRYRGLGLWTDADVDAGYQAAVDRGAYWFDIDGVGEPVNDVSIEGDNGFGQPGEDWGRCSEWATEQLSGLTEAERLATAQAQGTESGTGDYAVDVLTPRGVPDPAFDDPQVAAHGPAIIEEWDECLVAEGGRPDREAQALTPDGVLDLMGGYTAEQLEIMESVWAHERAIIEENDGALGRWDPAEIGYTAEDLTFLDEPRPRPVSVGGAVEERRIAEADVRCKQELGIVQRLADLDAAAQVKYIADNPEYFASRKEYDSTMLARAVEVLTDAGVDVPDVGEIG